MQESFNLKVGAFHLPEPNSGIGYTSRNPRNPLWPAMISEYAELIEKTNLNVVCIWGVTQSTAQQFISSFKTKEYKWVMTDLQMRNEKPCGYEIDHKGEPIVYLVGYQEIRFQLLSTKNYKNALCCDFLDHSVQKIIRIASCKFSTIKNLRDGSVSLKLLLEYLNGEEMNRQGKIKHEVAARIVGGNLAVNYREINNCRHAKLLKNNGYDYDRDHSKSSNVHDVKLDWIFVNSPNITLEKEEVNQQGMICDTLLKATSIKEKIKVIEPLDQNEPVKEMVVKEEEKV